MAIKLVLNSEVILNKKFPAVPRGYDPLFVDEFLDKVLMDYRLIEASKVVAKSDVTALEKRIKELEKSNEELRIENNKYKSRLENINEGDTVTKDNIHLVKRINVLEKYLYNHGVNPKTIK